MNQMKTVMLMGFLTALVLFLGQLLGGQSGLAMAFVFAVVMNGASYWFSDKIVLAMYRAKPMQPQTHPELFAMVEGIRAKMGLPMPRLYWVPEAAPNAFATGRDPQHAAVVVTDGLTKILDAQEMEGVLAHELAHVKNRDTLIMTVVGSMAGALSMLADMAMWRMLLGGSRDSEEGAHPLQGLAGLILAPMAASLIQMSISRTREFLADETGGRATGNPLALASALKKLDAFSKKIPLQNGTPATAHLFIMKPMLSGRQLLNLFSTHPATAERVQKLEQLQALLKN